MKLRIMGDSLRVRLSQTEVDKLDDEGYIRDATHFPGNSVLIYQIESVNSDIPACSFLDNNIILSIPQSTINDFVNTDMVGFDAEIDLEKKSKLSILIEKDFKCLTKRPNEDETDLYPNPQKSH